MDELPLDNAGALMRRAREAAGIDRKTLAQSTRIPERHLAAMEDGLYDALPGRTYVFGFARTYARAVGMDEAALLSRLKRELGAVEPVQAPPTSAFVPGDPARVPSARFAWGAGFAVLLLAGIGAIYWRMVYEPETQLPTLLPEPTIAAAPAALPTLAPLDAPSSAASVAALPGDGASGLPLVPAAVPGAPGAVVLTAKVDKLWVKVYDSAGKQLLQKQLGLGESYTVPADAVGPKLWTGRPDALGITVGGKPVPPIANARKIVKDVPLTAAALLARPVPSPAGVAAPASPSLPAAAKPAVFVAHHHHARANAATDAPLAPGPVIGPAEPSSPSSAAVKASTVSGQR